MTRLVASFNTARAAPREAFTPLPLLFRFLDHVTQKGRCPFSKQRSHMAEEAAKWR